MLDPLVLVGGAVGLAWLMDRRDPDVITYRAPPSGSIPSVSTVLRYLPRSLCTVDIRDDDGAPGASLLSASSASSNLVMRHYGAQLFALIRVVGRYDGGRPSPRTTVACLREWGGVWLTAYSAWWPEVISGDQAGNDSVTAARSGVTAAARSLSRVVTMLRGLDENGQGLFRNEVLSRQLTSAVARLAGEINNTRHLSELPNGGYVYARGLGGFWDAYTDNFDEHVATPVVGAVGAVAGGVGTAAAAGLARLAMSPLGAAALLGFVWWRFVK